MRVDRDGTTGNGGKVALMRVALAAVAVAMGPLIAACVGDPSNPAPANVGGGRDASVSDAAAPTTDAATVDAHAVDPFEGVWVGSQLGASVEISTAAGCARFLGSVDGSVCDECQGTYALGDAGTAHVVAKCAPRGACSVSPPHTNTGTFSLLDGGALSFVYDFGGGTSSVEAQPTPRTPGDVCGAADAGLRD